MINPVLKRIFVIVIIFCILIIGFLVYIFNFYTLPATSTDGSEWSDFSKWFEWKVTTNLTEEQKNVVEYLKKASTIFDKVFNTRCVQPLSKYGYSDPKEAIMITEQAIKQLKVLSCPEECVRYRNASIKIMENIIIYHQLRISFKEGTEEFDSRYNKFQLSEIKSGFDVKRYNEYFKSLRKVGLFDNYKEEIKNFR